MSKAAELFVIIGSIPVQISPFCANFKGRMQVNQYIGLGDDLPHRLGIRVFLSDMSALKAQFVETSLKGGFSGTARPDNTD